MKLIATNDNEIAEVINNLTYKQMVCRVNKFYTTDDILEILGYFDGTMDEHEMETVDELVDTLEQRNRIFELAVNNGNFQPVIAYNVFHPL